MTIVARPDTADIALKRESNSERKRAIRHVKYYQEIYRPILKKYERDRLHLNDRENEILKRIGSKVN